MRQPKLQRCVQNAGLVIASVAVLAMMAVGASDALSTFFGHPIPGALELAELLMVLVVFLALPDVEATRRHIAIDLVAARLPAASRRPLTVLSGALSVMFYGAMAWQGWRLFAGSWVVREQTTGLVKFPVYPTKALFAAALTVVTVIAVKNLAHALVEKRVITGLEG